MGYIGINGAGKSTTIKILTGILVLLTWVVPFGFVSFYPAGYLLNRGVGALAWLGPVVAGVLLLAGYRFWNMGLRHYSSTGS